MSDTDCRSFSREFGRCFLVRRWNGSGIPSTPVYISRLISTSRHVSTPSPGPALTEFSPVSVDEVHEVLRTMRIKSSSLDLLPSPLLRQSIGVFALVLAHMANLSFRKYCFPSAFTTAQVLPLPKKPGLDTAVLSNFRPTSNLVTVSKIQILERLAQGSGAIYTDRRNGTIG